MEYVWYTTHRGDDIFFIKLLTLIQIQTLFDLLNKFRVELTFTLVYLHGRLEVNGSKSDFSTAQNPA